VLGVENGDLGDNTPYTSRQRRTFEGRLIVFVRAEEMAKVHIRAAGLPDVLVQLDAQHP